MAVATKNKIPIEKFMLSLGATGVESLWKGQQTLKDLQPPAYKNRTRWYPTGKLLN